jgi:hypothetical protein
MVTVVKVYRMHTVFARSACRIHVVNDEHAKEVNDMKKTYTANDLAKELGISPKVLRAYLRKEHTRALEAKNTTWVIPAAVAAKAKKAFAKNVAAA